MKSTLTLMFRIFLACFAMAFLIQCSKKYSTSTTSNSSVIDIDSNIYNIVKIGTQVWMKENLKVTKYRNGDAIPNITDTAQWNDLTTDAWCYNNNDNSNNTTYGKLYNWYVVNDSRNICPVGWHIPTDAEWTILINYLGGLSVAGGKMKDTAYWSSPADNSSGFSALPGGSCDEYGTFGGIGNYAFWWSSTENVVTNYARYYYLTNDYSGIYRSNNKEKAGFSIRCVKD